MAYTAIGDIVVPSVFAPYVQQLTEEKSALVQSGAFARDEQMDELLMGGGKTFDLPSWQDLANTADNVDTANQASSATPQNIDSSQEVFARLKRNNSWGAADLLSTLAGSDPMDVAANRVAGYWIRRLQAAYIALQTGINKDNGSNDSGDYAEDIAGASFTDGVTNFSAEAFIDAANTLGDSEEDVAVVMMHSVVKARMQKNNLIDFIPDSEGRVRIPTFLGRIVVVDDTMPSGTAVVRGDGSAGVAGMYETWLLGPGQIRFGVGQPKVPIETDRQPLAGDGGGVETLTSRVEWGIHSRGHAYVGTAPDGGPSNAATANNLAAEASWNRVFPERKQIKFARLITRES